MEPLPTHRIALEPRSGIWLLFYETLYSGFYKGYYKQQLLRQVGKSRFSAELQAEQEKIRRGLNQFSKIIIRDNSQRNVMLREA